MDNSIMKKTQDTLGKVIKKPPLTDKLLGKPPFRFIHDIITEVIKNTGVLKGLFKSDELNSDNVKVGGFYSYVGIHGGLKAFEFIKAVSHNVFDKCCLA